MKGYSKEDRARAMVIYDKYQQQEPAVAAVAREMRSSLRDAWLAGYQAATEDARRAALTQSNKAYKLLADIVDRHDHGQLNIYACVRELRIFINDGPSEE